MSHKPPSREENPKMTWKAKKLVKRQEDTLKEVRRLKEEKEMQQTKWKPWQQKHTTNCIVFKYIYIMYVWEDYFISKIRIEYACEPNVILVWCDAVFIWLVWGLKNETLML